MDWKAWPVDALQRRVFQALAANRSYREDLWMGVPGSVLDRSIFPALPEFDPHPWLATWMANPNHIGCHTLGTSEPGFSGTHDLEREVVSICAEGILGAEPGTVDGYVASGGTESNIQALWTFRNALRARGVPPQKMAVVASSDGHYSMAKAADLLGLPYVSVPVDAQSRRMSSVLDSELAICSNSAAACPVRPD